MESPDARHSDHLGPWFGEGDNYAESLAGVVHGDLTVAEINDLEPGIRRWQEDGREIHSSIHAREAAFGAGLERTGLSPEEAAQRIAQLRSEGVPMDEIVRRVTEDGQL